MLSHDSKGKLIKPYQDQGVRWMMVKERDVTPGGILCDEMGLGKTAQTICTMLGDRKHTNTLILCPKSVVDQWASEIHKFAPDLRDHVLIHGGPNRIRDAEKFNKYKVVISSLGMIKSQQTINTELHRFKWYRVVVDEAHDMRTRSSNTFRSINNLDVRIRWCLTGTPIFNKIDDFVSLMRWVGVPRQYIQAGFRQCVDRYVLRRTKTEVGKYNEKLNLPECDIENVMIKLVGEEKKLYTDIYIRARNLINAAENSPDPRAYMMEILVNYMRCRQCLAYPELASKAIYNKEWPHRSSKLETLLGKNCRTSRR